MSDEHLCSLECPACRDAVFMRPENLYDEGEQECCPCGCLAAVSLDDWDPDEGHHAHVVVLRYAEEEDDP
jgi:hypothetical protein